MLTYVIEGVPIPWKAHGGYGRKSFNPLYKEKQYCQWQIRAQHNQEAPVTCPIRLGLTFFLPIPKATSGIRKRQMLNGVMHHIKHPDLIDLEEFIIDSLTGIIFEDKCQIFNKQSAKIYSDIPKTIIRINDS